MHEGALGIHEVELVVESGEDLGNGGRVGDHADSALHLCQVTAWDDGGGLVVDAALEASGAPVDKLDGALGLDGGDGSVDILGNDVAAVHQTAGHVLAVAGVALDHGAGRLKGRVGDLGHRKLLMVGLLGRDDGGVGGEHEVDAGVRHQVGLELGDVHVEGAVEPEGCGQGGHDLGYQAVQVGVGWALDVEGAAADIVECLVVVGDRDISVLKQRVHRQNRVVGLGDCCGDLGGRDDRETQLGLLAVVHGEALQQQGAQAGAGAAANGVEDHEALKPCAVVRELADAVEAQVDDLLADGVVPAGEVVGGVLLAGDELLGVEQLAVGAGADLVDHGGLKVDEDASRDVLAGAGLGKEGVEGVVAAADRLVGRHLAIGLDAVLQAVKLPAGVANLDAALAEV